MGGYRLAVGELPAFLQLDCVLGGILVRGDTLGDFEMLLALCVEARQTFEQVSNKPLPPPISLVSLGIRPFCGSLLFTEISEVLSEPLEAVSSLEDDPHAAIDVGVAPAAAMASRRRNVLFFISFSFNVDFSADYVDEKTIGHNMGVL